MEKIVLTIGWEHRKIALTQKGVAGTICVSAFVSTGPGPDADWNGETFASMQGIGAKASLFCVRPEGTD